MKGWLASGLLAMTFCYGACGAGDDTVEGTRAQCAYGGALTDCPDSEKTPEAACWRLVDCGRIPVDRPDQNFDWGTCVDAIESMVEDRRRPVIECIAASSCDELRVNDYCINFGER